MKAKKWLTIITLWISLILLPCIVMLFFYGDATSELIYNLMLAAFGSSLMGFIMSMTEYFTEKRKAMESFLGVALKYMDECKTVQHFSTAEPIKYIKECIREEDQNEWAKILSIEMKNDAKNGLISYFEENGQIHASNQDEYENMCEGMYKHKLEEYMRLFEICMKTYIEFSNTDFNTLSSAYGNLDFIFGNKRLKLRIYNEIYDEARKNFHDVSIAVFHFKIYFNSKKGNAPVNFEKLLELDKKWFREVVTIGENQKQTLVYASICNHLELATEKLRATIYNQKPIIFENHPIESRQDIIDS